MSARRLGIPGSDTMVIKGDITAFVSTANGGAISGKVIQSSEWSSAGAKPGRVLC